MTSNELNQTVDNLNRKVSNNSFVNSDSFASNAQEQRVSDVQVEEVDELLANMFKRGGY